jgi:uncharacterized protein YacL
MSLLVGTIFWSTDGLLNFTTEVISSRIWIISKTIVPLLSSIAGLIIIIKKWVKSSRDAFAISLFSALDLWILSPFYMYVMSMFSENGVMNLKTLGSLLIDFPFTAIAASTYSGALLGLIIASLALPFTGIILANKLERV